jgi:hypothetical protein
VVRRVLVVVLVGGLAAGGACSRSEPDPEPARWRIDPTADLSPSSRSLPIVVNERGCASGRSAEGRIEVDISYEADSVRLEVGVRPLQGDLECPGNPDTPYEVSLAEPLGSREVKGEDWPVP